MICFSLFIKLSCDFMRICLCRVKPLQLVDAPAGHLADATESAPYAPRHCLLAFLTSLSLLASFVKRFEILSTAISYAVHHISWTECSCLSIATAWLKWVSPRLCALGCARHAGFYIEIEFEIPTDSRISVLHSLPIQPLMTGLIAVWLQAILVIFMIGTRKTS